MSAHSILSPTSGSRQSFLQGLPQLVLQHLMLAHMTEMAATVASMGQACRQLQQQPQPMVC
jgi:hypothetical protein